MGLIDIAGIKDGVRGILIDANTTTGQPIDLSLGMSQRVKQVLQINVERMPVQIQPSFFPCITMFVDGKQVQLEDISRNMISGRRTAELDLKIIGVVWLDNISTAGFQLKDLADNECEILMENIEQVLRIDPTINGIAMWSKPTEVTFQNYPFSEGSHLRAGVMNFRIKVLY